jgi:alpha-tubulin suppressor-like RCC1 family protein
MSAGMTGAGRAVLRWILPVGVILLAAGPGSLVAVPQAALAASPGASSISAGLDRSCVVENGHGYCWGSDAGGTLGDGRASSSRTPVPVDTSGVLADKTLTQVSTGDDSATCALDSAGAAYCWGVDREGDLGDADAGGEIPGVPVAVYTDGVLAGKTLTQVTVGNGQACALDSAGFYDTCAVDFAGTAYCWGRNGSGALGYAAVPLMVRPQAPADVTAVSGYTAATVSWTAPAFRTPAP